MDECDQPSDAETIARCLSKNVGDLDWLAPLRLHSSKSLPTEWAAIGFDTNALKQLRRISSDNRTTILTYLESKSVPIILPAQAVQEFWNNHQTFTTEAAKLKSSVQSLASEFNKLAVGSEFEERLVEMANQLDVLGGEIDSAESPHLIESSVALWDALSPNATVGQVPRGIFVPLGESRSLSGIAPGFADSKRTNQIGDFLVWADFLMGLLSKGIANDMPSNNVVVFVTDDRKDDWVASGVPHPTLLGEVHHLTGKPLAIFRFAELLAHAKRGL